MENQNIEQLIEAILFWKGEPVSVKKLSEMVGQNIVETEKALANLAISTQGRGITLVRTADEVMLGTAPAFSKFIENFTKEEYSKELTRATLETLSIILFMSPIRRSLIDYVRGVNSQFSLRHLEVRGLIKKISDPEDNRTFLYEPTLDLISYLGVSSIDEISNSEEIRAKINEILQTKEVESKEESIS